MQQKMFKRADELKVGDWVYYDNDIIQMIYDISVVTANKQKKIKLKLDASRSMMLEFD